MSISLKDLIGYHIQATDGELGKVTDVYFDDKEWAVRYLVVKLGSWMEREKVLLSPLCVKAVDSPSRRIDVSLNRQQVKNSPDIDTDKTVTMKMEADTLIYYRWPLYWSDVGIWGTTANYPGNLGKNDTGRRSNSSERGTHLRSTREVLGYSIRTPDQRLGRINDVLVQKSNWRLESLVARTRRWLPSKSVLLAPKDIQAISWKNGEFQTSLAANNIRHRPKYDHAEQT